MKHAARMHLERDDLDWAAAAGLLSHDQADPLWRGLVERRSSDVGVRVSPSTGRVEQLPVAPVAGRFDLVHVAWYGGTLLIMGALGWFATLGIDAWGGPGVLGIASVYGVFFAVVGAALWRTADLKVLGGLLVAAAVSMVPAAVYGLERTMGWWPAVDPGSYRGFYQWIKGGWFAMEVATIVVGAVAVRLVPFSFVTLPIALSAWFMSMDLAGLLFEYPTTSERGLVSVVVGLGILAVATALRFKDRVDLNWWLEVFGLFAFQGGLLSMNSGSYVTKYGFLAIQLVLLTVGALWRRPSFNAAGIIGVVAVSFWAIDLSRDVRVAMSVGLGLMLLGYGLVAQLRRWWFTASFALVASTSLLAIGPFSVWARTDNEAMLVLFALWNIAVVCAGVFLRSRLMTMVGGLAVTTWLIHLADRVFAQSMAFPIVLVSLGIGVIAGGVFLHRRRASIDRFLDERLPARLRALRPDVDA